MPKDDGLIFLCLISYKIKTIVNLASSCTEISLNILVFYRILKYYSINQTKNEHNRKSTREQCEICYLENLDCTKKEPNKSFTSILLQLVQEMELRLTPNLRLSNILHFVSDFCAIVSQF